MVGRICGLCGDAIRGRPRNNAARMCKPCEEALADAVCAVCNAPIGPGVEFCPYCAPRATALRRAAERFYRANGHG